MRDLYNKHNTISAIYVHLPDALQPNSIYNLCNFMDTCYIILPLLRNNSYPTRNQYPPIPKLPLPPSQIQTFTTRSISRPIYLHSPRSGPRFRSLCRGPIMQLHPPTPRATMPNSTLDILRKSHKQHAQRRYRPENNDKPHFRDNPYSQFGNDIGLILYLGDVGD